LHNSSLGGHLGYKKLLKAVSKRFYWRNLQDSIK
jgi:Integrase zinc binding domain